MKRNENHISLWDYRNHFSINNKKIKYQIKYREETFTYIEEMRVLIIYEKKRKSEYV